MVYCSFAASGFAPGAYLGGHPGSCEQLYPNRLSALGKLALPDTSLVMLGRGVGKRRGRTPRHRLSRNNSA
eukprot:5600396-Alexandrium_andersonii.AAC.1